MAEIIYKQAIANVLPTKFLEYSQAVIIDRAIGDAFDGLKPVHRRILMSLHELGLDSNKPYRKCARTVGDCLGKFHPHGDQSVYDALVGMSQNFNMRYPLVDGSGNFGSVNGDPAAAMRYTEARLSPIGELMLQDVEKLSNMKDNFDNTGVEPCFLASYFPNILCNPSNGIAVGLAAKFAPHYAYDVYTAILKTISAQIKGKEIELENLIEIIKAPDFPSGGTIINGEEVKNIYRCGNGPVTIRAKYRIEGNSIIYYELPYKVAPKNIVQAVSELEISDIKDVRDESSLSGLRIVVELKKGANSEWIINKLFKDTNLQTNYSVNMTAIMDNRPVQNLDLKTIILYYLSRLSQVHYKGLTIEKEELARKIFINNTMLKAIEFIDNIIAAIRNSETFDDFANELNKLNVSREEADYIYNMKISSLSKASKMDLDKKKTEYSKEDERLNSIINDQTNFLKDMYTKLKNIRDSKLFKEDKRLTDIVNISTKNLVDMRAYIKNEPIIVTYTNTGFVRATRAEEYKKTNRNTVGVKAKLRDDEFILQSMSLDTHSDILLFTDSGRCFLLPAYKIPITNRNGAAKSINNYLTLEENENIIFVTKVPTEPSNYSLVLVTSGGYIKRTVLETLLKSRATAFGTKVITLNEGDKICSANILEQNASIAIFTDNGRGVIFNIDDESKPIRIMGKAARGVTSIKLKPNEKVISAAVLGKTGSMLLLTTKGFGKRLDIKTFKVGKRGQSPIIYMSKINEVGKIVGAIAVMQNEDVIITTMQGQILRINVNNLNLSSRIAKGIKMINIKDNEDYVVSLAAIEEEKIGEEEVQND